MRQHALDRQMRLAGMVGPSTAVTRRRSAFIAERSGESHSLQVFLLLAALSQFRHPEKL